MRNAKRAASSAEGYALFLRDGSAEAVVLPNKEPRRPLKQYAASEVKYAAEVRGANAIAKHTGTAAEEAVEK